MKAKAVISSKQLIIIMIIIRLMYSTTFLSGLKPGNSIQDAVIAVPALFIINFIIGIPIIMLLKRHPGRNLVECSTQIMGPFLGGLIGLLYCLYLLYRSSIYFGEFHMIFTAGIIPEASGFAIALPLVIVCVYGAIKGIETIARFGSFVFVVYAVIVGLVIITLVPSFNTLNLLPLFYNGFHTFTGSTAALAETSFEILILAMCTPFLKPEVDIKKTYIYWNVFSSAALLVLISVIVLTMGPFAGKTIFPLFNLSSISSFNVFARLDTFALPAWILETLLGITVLIYLSSQCLYHIGIKKYRRTVIIIISVIVAVFSNYVTLKYNNVQMLEYSPFVLLIASFLFFILPLIILLADIIKGKVADNEKADQ